MTVVACGTGLTACTAGPDPGDDVAAVVTDYFALLEAGEAQAAGELDTFDAAASSCPALFNDEVYRTVVQRPTDLTLVTVDLQGDDAAHVTATVDVAGYSDEPVGLGLVRTDDGWLIDNARAGIGSFDLAGTSSAGAVTVQDQCSRPLDGPMLTTTEAYPGTWTVSYADALGVGSAPAVQVPVVAWSEVAERRSELVTFTPVPDPSASGLLDAALASLVDECVAAGLESPSCPPNVDDAVSRRGTTLASAGVISYPDPLIEEFYDGAWHYRATAAVVDWTGADGVERSEGLVYLGTVSVEGGVAVPIFD